MPALIDLLDQYLFSDAPGMQARVALRRAWELASGSAWNELYLASLEDALSEELPHLSAYSGRSTQRPTRDELGRVLTADLGEAGNAIAALDQTSRGFLTELARAMQTQRLVTINQHNLFTDEYRQILLNLFDHTHTRFKSVVARNEPEFSAALATATGYDSILAASITNFLERQFGILLPTLDLTAPRAAAPGAATKDNLSTPVETQARNEPEAFTQPEPISESPNFGQPDSLPEPVADAFFNEPLGEAGAAAQPVTAEPPAEGASAPQAAPPLSEPEPARVTIPPPVPSFASLPPAQEPRQETANAIPNRLRVLLATPADVMNERRMLADLVRELDTRSRARFGVEIALVNPAQAELATGQSPVELADVFIGVVWLQFGTTALESDANGASYFAGTQNDFSLALEQGSARDEGWLRTVIYRSIRPPSDLLHLNVAEYARVQQFFERAGAYAGDDLVRVYADPSELIHDARARLDAWIYNYAGDLAFALSEYGKNAVASAQPSDALDNFSQAIALYRELDRPEQELALWLQVGGLHEQQNNRAAATEAFDTALRLARRVEDDPAAAQALRALGTLDANAGEWQNALKNYQEAQSYLQPGEDAYRALLADQVAAHQAFGDAEHARGEFVRSADAYRHALTRTQELGDTPRAAALWQKLAALAVERNEWNEALASFDNALANLNLTRDAETRRAIYDAQAHAHAQLATAARAAGDNAAAERSYQAALRADAQGSATRPRRIAWFSTLGALAYEAADWNRSIEANEQALALLDSPQDVEARRALLTKQAEAYQKIGADKAAQRQWDAANSAYRDALGLYQELEVQQEQGALLCHLGSIALAQERAPEANAYFTQALPRLQVGTDLYAQAIRGQASALQHIGDAHLDAHEWGQAEIAYVQARGNLEQLTLGNETGPLLYRLGVVTAAQSRLPESLAYFQQARARLTSGSDTEARMDTLRAESETLRRFADMYRGAGDFQSAHAHYRQQLELAQELQDDALEADAFHSLGLIAADQGEWDNAIDLYDQALGHLNDPAQANRRTFVERHQLGAYEKLGERERAEHHLPQAELAYRSALTLAQALNEREREADLLYILGLISIEHENWEEALVDLRRALGIYNLMPVAPNKPKVIWSIGRAQRGQKHAQLVAALEQAQEARAGGTWSDAVPHLETGLQLARELGDAHNEGMILAELGDIASSRAATKADWESALESYRQAIAKLTQPQEQERRSQIRRAELNARRERSDLARTAQQWANADQDLAIALDLAQELDDSAAQGELVYRRGRVAAGQARWNEAIDLYSDALNRYDDSSEMRATIERAQAEAYQSLGDTERDAQNWEGAESAYAQALALQRGLKERAAQAYLLTTLGDVATRQARWSDAVERLTQARLLTQELGTPEQLEALDADIQLATQALKREQQADAERRGDAKRSAREYEAARAEYTEALTLAQALDDRAAQAELNAKLGFVATERGAYSEALDLYRFAAGAYDAPENASQRNMLMQLQAETLQELGNRAGEAGKWNQALQNYAQAVALLDEPSQTEQRNGLVRLQAVTLQNIGDDARIDERWQDALDAYRRAAGLFTLLGAADEERVVWEREAYVLSHLARAAHSAKDYTAAQSLYSDAVARLGDAGVYDGLRHARGEQRLVYRDSADALLEQQDYLGARRNYRQALSIAEELDDRASQAELYHRLGQLAARQQDWQGAILSYQYALERADDPLLRRVLLDQQEAYQALGTTQRIAGDYSAAESSYSRAYANAQSLDDSPRMGELAFLLGMLSADQNAWESALGYYQRALTTLEPNAAERRDIKSYQAAAYQELGDAQRANGQFDAAASAYTSGLTLADELNDDARAGQLLYRQGLLQAAQGQWEQALDQYKQAETRLGDLDPGTRLEVERDGAFATRAVQRQQLTAQLDHAANARANQDWEDSATAFRSALALAETLNDHESVSLARRALVDSYAEKASTLRADAWWDEATESYRESLALAREYQYFDDAAQRQRDLLAVADERANALRRAGEWADAESAAQQHLALAQEFEDAGAEADAYYNLGVTSAEQERWVQAKEYYEQARQLFVSQENAQALVALDADLAKANDVLQRRARLSEERARAESAVAADDLDRADHSYRSALDLAQGLGDTTSRAAIAAALVGLAKARTRTLYDAGDWQNAERAAQEQFGVAQEFQDLGAQADAIATLGDIAVAQQQWATAKNYYAQAQTLYAEQARADDLTELNTKLDRVNDVLDRQARQAQTFSAAQDAQTRQRYDDAISSYRESLELARGLGDQSAVQGIGAALVNVTTEKANTLRAEQAWDAASAAYKDAIEVAREFEDAPAQANGLYTLGAIAATQASWQAAKEYFEQARPLLPTDDTTALDAVDKNLVYINDILDRQTRQSGAFQAAEAARQQGWYAQAAELYRTSLDLARGLNDESAEAALAAALVATAAEEADALAAQTDREATDAAYRRARAVALEFGNADAARERQTKLISLSRERAGAFRAAQNWQEATEAYRQSLALAQEFQDAPAIAAAQSNLVELANERAAGLRAAQDWEQAADAYRQTLFIAQEFENTSAVTAARTNLIALANERAEGFRAAQNWDSASAAYRESLALAQEFEDADGIAAAQSALIASANERALALRREQNWRPATDAYRRVLGIAQEFQDAPAVAAAQANLVALSTEHAKSLREAGDTQNAERAAQEQFAVAQEFADVGAQADALATLGDIAAERELWTTARTYYSQAIALVTEQDRAAEFEAVNTRLADVNDILDRQARQAQTFSAAQDAQTQQRYAEAVGSYRESLDLARSLKDESAVEVIGASLIAVTAEQAKALHTQQQWSQSQDAYRNAISVAHEFGDEQAARTRQTELVALVAEQAGVLRGQSAWSESAAAYRNALQVAHEFGGEDAARRLEASLIALAVQETDAARMGQDPHALERAAQNQLARAQEFNDVPAQADALYTLGLNAASQQKLRAAKAYYEQAQPLFAESGDTLTLVSLEQDLARVNDVLERQAGQLQALSDALRAEQEQQYEQATEFYRSALQYAQGLNDTDAQKTLGADLVRVARARANAARTTNNLLSIEHAAQQQFAVAQEFGDAGTQGDALVQLGTLAESQDELEMARGYLSQALPLYQSARSPVAFAQAQLALHRVERVLDQRAQLQTTLANAQSARGAGQLNQAVYDYRTALANEQLDAPTTAHVRVALGNIAAEQQEWEAALEEYAQAGDLFDLLEQPQQVAALAVEQARVTRRLQMRRRDQARSRGDREFQGQQTAEAADSYRYGLALAETLDDTASVGEFQLALGNVAGSEQRWSDAVGLYAAAAENFANAQDTAQRTTALEHQLGALIAAGDESAADRDWQRARGTYLRAWLLAERLERNQDQVQVLHRAGQVANEQNDLHAAVQYYDRALQILGAAGDPEQRAEIAQAQADVWEQLGNAEMDANQFASAERSYANALARTRELDASAQTAQILHSLGLVRGAQGNWQGAREAHQEAYTLVQDLDLPQVQLSILTALADSQQRVGELESAHENYASALEIAQELDETLQVADLALSLGDVSAQRAYWQDALQHYEHARAVQQTLGVETGQSTIDQKQANAYVALGDMLHGEGQWDAANAAYMRAMELDAATERTDRDGYLLYRLGLASAAEENYAEAIAQYDRASAALSSDEDELRDRILAQLAFALQQEGKRAIAAGDWAQAETVFTRARKMAEASDNFDQVADLWGRLGKIYTAEARTDEALDAFRRAYEFDRMDGSALHQRDLSETLAELLLQRGRAELEQADNAQAAQDLREALTFAEQAENPQLLGSTLEALGETARNAADPESAIEYYARAGRTFATIEDTDRWRIVSGQQAELVRSAAERQLGANEFADAENLYRRAWLLQQAVGDTAHDAETHAGLGRALLAQERYDEALVELEQAEGLLQEGAPERAALRAPYADTWEAIGRRAMSDARWDDAARALTRAAAYRDELDQRDRAGLDWQQLAEIAAQQHALDEAVFANEQALARLGTPETSQARRAVLQQQAQILAGIGDDQQRAGEWAQASETYRRALAIAQEQGDLETLAQLYNMLGSLAVAQQRWDQARTEYVHALDVYQELDQPVAQADTLTQLGDMHRDATQYDDARQAFESAQELYRASGKRLNEGAMWLRLGHVEGDREEWDRALDRYQAAIHLYNEIGARTSKSEAYRALERAVRNAKLKQADQAAAQADLYVDAEEWQAAEDAYLEALDLYDEAGDRLLRSQMQNQVGIVHQARRNWDKALASYSAALDGFQEYGVVEAQVSVLINIGDVQRSRELWDESEQAYQRAYALNLKVNDTARAGELENALGLVREAQAQWQGAAEHYEIAATLFQTAGLAEAQSAALANRARVNRSAQLQEKAELEQALEVARRERNLAEAGELLNTLGLLAAEDKKWDEALDYYREAVTTFERLEAEADMDPVWRTAQGTVLNNIGDASQSIGAWRDADYAYTRALGLAREIGDRESEAVLLNNLGVTAQAQEQLPRALDLNMQALESYRVLGDDTPRVELLERVGNLQLELGQQGAAENTYREALGAARTENDSERAARLLRQLGLLAEGRGADEEALAYYQEALTRSIELAQVNEQKTLLARQGKLYKRAAQWEQAERAQQAALSLAIAQGDEPLQAELHMQLGQAAQARADWRSALSEYQAALDLYGTFDAPQEQFELHQHIGRALVALGEFAQADESYRAALEIAARMEQADTTALWSERAALAEQEQRWSDAAGYYENARVSLANDAPAETRIHLALRRGDAALHALDWNTADVSFNDALEMANTSDNRAQYGWGMTRLGLLAQAQHNWDEALESFQEAIEILRVNEQPLGEAQVLNHIARLKLETNNPAEADLFAQAALTIAQALGGSAEASRSLYLRGLVALNTQEFGTALRFMNQAIAADPSNWAAQLQLGNTLLAEGKIAEAVQQAEAGLGHTPAWELGAQTQLTIGSLHDADTRPFKANLKRTRGLLGAGRERNVPPEFLDAVDLVLRAMEGNAEGALAELNTPEAQPALPGALDAQRFARTALLALSKSPRRFKGKPALVTYFAPPKPRARPGSRRRSVTGTPPPAPPARAPAQSLPNEDVVDSQDSESQVE